MKKRADFSPGQVTRTETSPRELCIHQLFEEQVERTPDSIAVVFPSVGSQRGHDQQLTYRELNRRADRLAHYLRKLGVGPEVLVGLCVERSVEMIMGLLGILKAGGAYVPIDPGYPKERIAFILSDTKAPVVLTQQSLLPKLSLDTPQTLCLDSDWKSVENNGQHGSIPAGSADNLAYVIYTSGSTGQPKGVAIAHRGVVALLHCARAIFTDEDLSGVLGSTSICFDLSVLELFPPLIFGGTVLVVDNVLQLPGLRSGKNVTLINTVPSAISELLRMGALPASVRTVGSAGEPLRTPLVKQIYDQGRVERVFDLYGPTEDTVCSTFVLRSGSGPETIGRPIAKTRIYLLDSELNPVPAGAPGEMHIAGAGLARGYLRRPELTAEKFIPNPFGNEPGTRLYKTGDLARYLPDGDIEFLGRLDYQVKIRGFRIELGEIEAALSSHPAVSEAIVSVRESAGGDKYLAAYVVPVRERKVSATEMRCFLMGKLPPYMIPSALVFLEELPHTPNGKVDRRALPAPERHRPDMTTPNVQPRTPVEEALAVIWCDVLGVSPVGVHDDFLELGGHSLKATQIASRIREAFKIELPLHHIFATPTIARLAEGLAEEGVSASTSAPRAIASVVRGSVLPLSFSQERVWFIQQLDPANLAYNFQASFRFTGFLDVVALARSLNEIVSRHEIFRTTFPSREGRPLQVIHDFREFALPVIDLAGLPESEREAEVQERIQKDIRQPFDIARLPLIRWTLFRLGPSEHILLHGEHHLVHDGWSFTVFVRELLDLYRAFSVGNDSPFTAPPTQFADFALWQREWLTGEIVDRQLAFWGRKLAGSPPVLALPTVRPRPPVQTFRGAAPRVELRQGLCESLRAFSRREGATLYMTLLAAFFVLLHRYTGQTDICVGSAIANRRWRETEDLIGMVLNNVVLRADVSNNPRFVDFLRQIRAVTLSAAEHQDVPFDHVVRALQLERDPSRNPLFDVMFSFHDSPMPELGLPNLRIDLTEVLSNRSAKFDLNIIVIPRTERRANRTFEADDGITMVWEYATDLFDASTIRRMIDHYQALVEGIVADPAQRISELPLLTELERRQTLVEWNDTQKDYPRGRCIHELLEIYVERIPDAVAVVFEGAELTYRDLNIRANQLAHHLRRLGAGPEVPVGVCMERSLEMIVAILAILKAGGAYLPLDPAYPKERLAFMLENAGASVLVTQSRLVSQLPRLTDGGRGRLDEDNQHRSSLTALRFPVVCLDSDWEAIAHESQANPANRVSADNLAYVMYTSGSTGTPKGVGVTHRNVTRLVKEQNYAELTEKEVFLQFAPLSFDASTFEIWGCLLNGGKLVVSPACELSPDDLAKVIQASGVTTLWLTSALFHLMADHHLDSLRGIKQLLAGGDVLSVPHVKRVIDELPRCRLINGYGPTENTTFSCSYPMTSAQQVGDSVSIGRPISNSQAYILDHHLNPVPLGVPGELYVGGDGLARGYFHDPELTAEKFIPNPFSREPGARLYKTGDLGRYLRDGNIEFLGRIDHQVKIRGFRVALGEIETMLCQHPAIAQAVAAVAEAVRGDKSLVAYVVSNQEPAPTTSELRDFLKQKLPEYMVPNIFVFLPSLPLLPNGKVNRHALPAPDQSRPDLKESFAAPQTPAEKIVAAIWEEVLGLDKVGIRDNFFELGGHSLMATQVVSRLRDAFTAELPLRALFEKPTVAELALLISDLQSQNIVKDRDLVTALAELESMSDEQALQNTMNKTGETN